VAFNACLRYIHRVRPRDHISHLESSVTNGHDLRDIGRDSAFDMSIQNFTCETSILKFFLVSLCIIGRNLVVPLHRSHAMSHSFTVRRWFALELSFTLCEGFAFFGSVHFSHQDHLLGA
jgi:hypothetical protein